MTIQKKSLISTLNTTKKASRCSATARGRRHEAAPQPLKAGVVVEPSGR